MFDFDGNAGGSGNKVSLAGHGRNRTRGAAEESRSDFVKRQHKEREARERKRLRERAATQIQAVFRRYRCVKLTRAGQRQIFDKRIADIAKVGAVLPDAPKAKFVFHALMPMLRLFAFFFSRGEDEKRLSAMLQWVAFSAGQAPPCNVFHLALADDAAQRRGFLVVFEKLLSAMLCSGMAQESARLLLSMQAALLSGPGLQHAHVQKSGAFVGHLLRRTDVLVTLTREVLPLATEPQAVGQAVELVLLCCAGLEACDESSRQRPLVCLLSTPRLGERLCEAPGVAPRECLQRLVAAAPGAPAAGALAELVQEGIEGVPRRTWLLSNLVVILERYLLAAGEALVQILPLWLSWLCWVKEQNAGGPADERFAGQLDRLHASQLVRALVRAMEQQGDADGLLAVCRFYFAGGDGSEPPAEVLQTLAFATPLVERLFPMLVNLMRISSVSEVFEALGPPALDTPQAMRLRVFCMVYALQMQPMYDYEFFGPANPLRMDYIQLLTPFLNRLAYHFVTTLPDVSLLGPAAKALRSSLTSLVCLLYNRHCRRPILQGESAWIIQESKLLIRRAAVVDLGTDDPAEEGAAAGSQAAGEDDRMDVEEEPEPGHEPQPPPQARGAARAPTAPGGLAAERPLEAVLEEIPHVLPFADRVALLQNVIQADQEQRRDTRGPWSQYAMQRHQIRRNFLVEDGFAAFESLTDEGQLRDVFRVEFIAPDGTPESGVDGGGLFKEFMVTICRAMFDPQFGMFSATSDQTLYPSVSAFRVHEKALELYTFLGKVVGKAIYEMFLLEPQFSRVFLNRLLGRTNEVDDVAALDRELHRNMLRIKEANNVEELNLTFSVSVSEMGHYEEIDLIPNGRNIPVTRENLTRYFHLMANYKTNVQFQRHSSAFLRGVQCVIPLTWLKMFDPYELNILISGSPTGFDVQDLRQNTNYSGGYQDDSPVIQWLWQLLQHHMEPEDMGRFLMFATSCSRAPLLGFKTLYPKFCIHRVPDGERLPTASTCANLLKLPDYTSPEVLQTKVTQAIRAEAGFDLS